MASFPLFNMILLDTEISKDEVFDNKKHEELVEKIEKMDNEGNEIILALIRNYQLETDQGIYEELPYDCKSNKSGYKFTVNKLPNRLILMISHFVDLHLKKQIEENQRNNIFNK
jgi:hypothetical protein